MKLTINRKKTIRRWPFQCLIILTIAFPGLRLSATELKNKVLCSRAFDLKLFHSQPQIIAQLLQSRELQNHIRYAEGETLGTDISQREGFQIRENNYDNKKALQIVTFQSRRADIKIAILDDLLQPRFRKDEEIDYLNEFTRYLPVILFFDQLNNNKETSVAMPRIDALRSLAAEGLSNLPNIIVTPESLNAYAKFLENQMEVLLELNPNMNSSNKIALKMDIIIVGLQIHDLLHGIFTNYETIENISLTISRSLARGAKKTENRDLVIDPINPSKENNRKFEIFAKNGMLNVLDPVHSRSAVKAEINLLSRDPAFVKIVENYLAQSDLKAYGVSERFNRLREKFKGLVGLKSENDLEKYVRHFQSIHKLDSTTQAFLHILAQQDLVKNDLSYKFGGGPYRLRFTKIDFAGYLRKASYLDYQMELKKIGIAEKYPIR